MTTLVELNDPVVLEKILNDVVANSGKNNTRYQETVEGDILDTQTGLVWMKEYKFGLSFGQAIQYAQNVSLRSGVNWRVPTCSELYSLIDLSEYNPATTFPNSPSLIFWTSTEYSKKAKEWDFAWHIDFREGFPFRYSKGELYEVRLVRDNVEN